MKAIRWLSMWYFLHYYSICGSKFKLIEFPGAIRTLFCYVFVFLKSQYFISVWFKISRLISFIVTFSLSTVNKKYLYLLSGWLKNILWPNYKFSMFSLKIIFKFKKNITFKYKPLLFKDGSECYIVQCNIPLNLSYWIWDSWIKNHVGKNTQIQILRILYKFISDS